MIGAASKLATSSTRAFFALNNKSVLKLCSGGNLSSSLLFRNLTSEARRSLRAKVSPSLGGTSATTAGSTTPISLGQGFLAGASALGLGALCYYGLGFSSEAGILEKSAIWPQYVRERISSTFAYLGGGLAVTAGSLYGVSRSPALMNIAMKNSLMAILATFALVIGSGMVVRSMPYEQNGPFGAKHLAWMGHAALLGGMIAPLSLMGGPLLMRAALYTAGLVGGLSAVAATAPSEKFLNMGGPLALGLGFVFAASVGSAFFPPMRGSTLGLSLYSVSIYGGLVLFSMFLLYDTQRIVKKAEHQLHFDPINESMSVYMDILNIFIRIATIMGGNRRK